jgi:chaperonin GroEL
MKQTRRSKLIFQPDTYRGFQRGVNILADAIAPTLGPFPGHVAIQPADRSSTPEILDDGATIARRLIQLEDRSADMGAMYLRQLLWAIHENIGDGTATTAVLFRAIYNDSLRFITAGGNAMLLRRQLESLIPLLDSELHKMATPIQSKTQLIQFANSICNDSELATHLGEILDTIGEYGSLEIQTSHTLQDECKYIQGAYWTSKPLINDLLPTHSQGEQVLINPSILVTDLTLNQPEHIISILQAAIQAKAESLLILAFELSPQASAVIRANNQSDRIKVMVMQVPGITTEERFGFVDDIAMLTGSKPLLDIAQDSPSHITPNHLGRARNVWVSNRHFGLAGGSGDTRALYRHIQQLKSRYTTINDLTERQKLQSRLGVLLGGTAVLRVAGLHEIEAKRRKALAERTATSVRGVLKGGVVLGGGTTCLKLSKILRTQTIPADSCIEQKAAHTILSNALESPIRTLVKNAGYDIGCVLSTLDSNSYTQVFDLRIDESNDVDDTGLFDSASTLNHVIRATIQSVALALTIDVLFQHENPTISDIP